MFRLTDIRNIAIEIEKNGEASYRQAAAKVQDARISEVLTMMADEELRHRKWFESIQENTELPPEHAELEQMGKSLLQDMLANQTFSLDQDKLDHAETFSELLKQSKAFEEDTILFYEFLGALIDDKSVAAELELIIKEEKEHAARLEELVTACA